ncbi:MAG: DUF177 domain-containing protein [Sphingomonadales bacterium]|nr:DUF177 domain-containing protein [Sphingomonadales bacterium]
MKSPFVIPFVGLKLGLHEFEFDIDKSFFESLPYSLIEDGRLSAFLELEKKETMLIANLEIVGYIFTTCDRCTEPLSQEIEGEFTLYYTFGKEESEDENLIILAPESYQIDISQPLYELISLSMPAKLVHEEGECNEEMVALLAKYQQPLTNSKPDQDDIDPRWSALKNLN